MVVKQAGPEVVTVIFRLEAVRNQNVKPGKALQDHQGSLRGVHEQSGPNNAIYTVVRSYVGDF